MVFSCPAATTLHGGATPTTLPQPHARRTPRPPETPTGILLDYYQELRRTTYHSHCTDLYPCSIFTSHPIPAAAAMTQTEVLRRVATAVDSFDTIASKLLSHLRCEQALQRRPPVAGTSWKPCCQYQALHSCPH